LKIIFCADADIFDHRRNVPEFVMKKGKIMKKFDRFYTTVPVSLPNKPVSLR
jgi:hypothetical protein